MRRLAAVLAAVAVTAGVLVGCGGQDGNWAKQCTTTSGVVECTPDERPTVAPITGELLDGKTYDMAQDKGKVVVVNFWGSWCAPCRAEADDLENTYQATKDKGVTFLGVNSRDDRDAAREFERGRVTYPSLYDFPGKVGIEFDVTNVSMPATLIIDRQGRIAVALRQATTESQLKPLVEKIAAEGQG
jgi:thiol-disulfide isomerase/thioredoxin